jgi:LacI family transcriptional regulator
LHKRPTYADVAQRAGVSPTTVSFVLNGRAHEMSIPSSTCDKVLSAAKDLNYKPNRVASSLAQGKTSTIGVIVPRLESNFFANIVHGIQEVADDAGCRLLLGYSRHDPRREAAQVELLIEHRVDGIICLADEFTAGSLGLWLNDAHSQGLPIVVVDEASYTGQVDCVVPDDEYGVALAMQRLLDQGHTRIAHVAGPDGHSTSRERLMAYKGSLVGAKIPYDASLVVGCGARHEELSPLIRLLLSMRSRPTAVFAANDVRAARVVEVMRELGLSHSKDIELIGFGNLEVSRTMGFTTIDQDPQEMGKLAMRRLLVRIQSPHEPPQVIRSCTKLLVRDGVGRVDYSMA